MERSCADLLFGSLLGNSYVREKSYEGLAVVSRISWHVGGHVLSESNLYRESKKHVEGMLRLFSVFGRLFFSILSQMIS